MKSRSITHQQLKVYLIRRIFTVHFLDIGCAFYFDEPVDDVFSDVARISSKIVDSLDFNMSSGKDCCFIEILRRVRIYFYSLFEIWIFAFADDLFLALDDSLDAAGLTIPDEFLCPQILSA